MKTLIQKFEMLYDYYTLPIIAKGVFSEIEPCEWDKLCKMAEEAQCLK